MLNFIAPQTFTLFLEEEFDDLQNFSKQDIENALTEFNTKMQKYFEKESNYCAKEKLSAFYVDFIFSLNLGKEETYIAGVIALSVIHMNCPNCYPIKNEKFYQLINDFHSKKLSKEDFFDQFCNLSNNSSNFLDGYGQSDHNFSEWC